MYVLSLSWLVLFLLIHTPALTIAAKQPAYNFNPVTMKKELVSFLSAFELFKPEEINELAELMTVVSVKKNSLIVKEGEVCNHCFFVLRGCLRQYVVIDGLEKSTAFYTEHQAVNFFTSYTSQTVSACNLYSLEDSILLVGNPVTDAELYQKFPVLEKLTRKMMEEEFGKTQDNFSKFITSSPEERYLNLLNERPGLLQRVPLIHIASYLGITPESLSRIRKRILVK